MFAQRRFSAGGASAPRLLRAVGRRAAGLALLGALAGGGPGRAAEPNAEGGWPLELSAWPDAAATSTSLETRVYFPNEAAVFLRTAPSNWAHTAEVAFEVWLPDDAPTNVQVLLHLKDWDHLWYQLLLPGMLRPGERTLCRADLSPTAAGWTPRGHHASWHFRARLDPREVGLRLLCPTPYEGLCRFEQARAARWADESPPFIRNVTVNRRALPCYEKLELTFELPDRYVNPFDPAQVEVTADIEEPHGARVAVAGYYGQQAYREVTPAGERVLPQGRPYWRVRFAPRKPGLHRYTLQARDAWGTAAWGPERFEATPPTKPGYVRVAAADPRHFERSDGSFFFPIGHNIRSPSDARLDTVFPWTYRPPEGATAYLRYFADMAANGENVAEVWNCAWSLGLEWSALRPGYRGIGQYNLLHAWEMDRVLEAAETRGICINFVVHNHGKFSTFSDEEWKDNPYNTANGGYLSAPEEYFDNPRARRDFLQLMRYIIARWGYSTHIFAWELWSELDLTGSRRESGGVSNYRRPEVVEWHRAVGRAIKDMDPYHHLVSTHVCGDYTHQNLQIVTLPEMDLCPVDAYHGNEDALHIVELLKQTAAFNNPLGKPVLVTEFGGTWAGQGLRHLDDSLHAALWASTAIPVAGTPLFWWWKLIEEENFYPKFAAVSRYLAGEDRRDPQLVPADLAVWRAGGPAWDISAVALASPRRALGWIYRPADYRAPRDAVSPQTNLTLRLDNLEPGVFTVECWDTVRGEAVACQTASPTNGLLSVALPPWSFDLAVKIKAQ